MKPYGWFFFCNILANLMFVLFPGSALFYKWKWPHGSVGFFCVCLIFFLFVECCARCNIYVWKKKKKRKIKTSIGIMWIKNIAKNLLKNNLFWNQFFLLWKFFPSTKFIQNDGRQFRLYFLLFFDEQKKNRNNKNLLGRQAIQVSFAFVGPQNNTIVREKITAQPTITGRWNYAA